MRDSCLKSFATLLLLVSASACDSGQSSRPEETESTDGGASTTSTATSSTVTDSTASTSASATNTSTTGGNTGGGSGLVYETGKGCTPGVMANSGTLTGQWGKIKTTIDGLEYFIQVNQWNSTASQTMTYGGDHYFRMTQQDASVPTNGGPTGFPSMFIGGNSNNVTNGSNLPKQVSTLTAVPTSWEWDDAGTLANNSANSYNATYDVWFSQGADGEPGASHPSGAFLMVWYHKPFDAQPLGQIVESGVSVPGAPGTWNVWIGENGQTPAISYVAPQTVSYMDFDLNDFIKHAVARGGTVQNSHYLTNVFVGFEIWRGGVNVETTSFCAEVL